jgi:WD40 repeat protein
LCAPFWSCYHEQVEEKHSTILHSSDTDLLVATASSKGVIRLWSADYSLTAISSFKCVAVAEQWVSHGRPKGLHGLRYNARVCADPEGDESISIGREQLIVPDAEQNLSFLTISSDKQLPSLALDRTIVGHNDEI